MLTFIGEFLIIGKQKEARGCGMVKKISDICLISAKLATKTESISFGGEKPYRNKRRSMVKWGSLKENLSPGRE